MFIPMKSMMYTRPKIYTSLWGVDKLILSFHLLGLEIAFSSENEMTVFANQNTLSFLNFRF